jgi:NADH-quinone oxidoreductase subunit E
MDNKLASVEITPLIQQAIQKYGATNDALILILNEVNLAYGYIPKEAIIEIRKQMQLIDNRIFNSESQIFGLASFYQMFSTKPLGRHVVRFCESAPCHVMGGRLLIQALKDELKIEPGETSTDGKWSLITTSCLGVCGVGPVILINEDIYGNVKPEEVKNILGRYD